jgi:hypothetical protein
MNLNLFKLIKDLLYKLVCIPDYTSHYYKLADL